MRSSFAAPLKNQPSRYISQYLDFVATADNISLLHHLAMKCKTVRDSDPKFPNEVGISVGSLSNVLTFAQNLYMLSELAQELIVAYARDKGWTLTTWPGKVKMPTDIFRPLATAGESSEVGIHVDQCSTLACSLGTF